MQPRKVLEAIAQVLSRPENQHVLVLADEIYERIAYDEEHVCFASLPGMYERTITVNGMSKAYGMTGFRLGYMAAPLDIIDPCRKILSQVCLYLFHDDIETKYCRPRMHLTRSHSMPGLQL